jgi:hypothetical protein
LNKFLSKRKIVIKMAHIIFITIFRLYPHHLWHVPNSIDAGSGRIVSIAEHSAAMPGRASKLAVDNSKSK